MAVEAAPGFYGKVISHGDFVSRRLSRTFIDSINNWLQSAISVSREQLAANWLDVYLTSPIWRFVISNGICDQSVWAGVLMPSVDRVGRCFPLIIACPATNSGMATLLIEEQEWFEKLEDYALTTLEDKFDLEDFDLKLKNLEPISSKYFKKNTTSSDIKSNSKNKAFHIKLKELAQLDNAFFGLTNCLFEEIIPPYSFWCTSGSDHVNPTLLACEGLPPINAFTALLNGQWEHRGWHLQEYGFYRQNPTSDSVSSNLKQKQQSILDLSSRSDLGSNDSIETKWQSCGYTDIGKVRQINQDTFLERPDEGLWAVADGMGGHCAGEVASKLIVESLHKVDPSPNLKSFVFLVDDCLQQVNKDLLRLSQERYRNELVGSTVIVFLASENRCAFLWAGDSRLYRYRQGKLIQLSRDHTVYDEAIGEEELLSATNDTDQCNMITRAVGHMQDLSLDIEFSDFLAGDIFLLCSDGLTKEIHPVEIATILDTHDCGKSAKALIDLSLDRGARDNVTVIVIHNKTSLA